ncbi:MAG TPA: hypothetical protein VHA06_20050 [Candidatus Angelobacter sp.]|jgi:hypothetical protein|nr:hypothetical protein [Candidatus Angelobacter sp.]
MNTLLLSSFLLLLLVFFNMPSQHRDVKIAQEEPQLEIQIATDQPEYHRSEEISLKFYVVNRGKTPVYLSRGISYCTFWSGYLDLQILDKEGRNVVAGGCSAEHFIMSGQEVLQEMQDPKQWVLLNPNEIFGNVQKFWTPKNKGKYHIKVELAGPVLSADQEQFLLQNHVSFIQHRIGAPIVPITIK